MHPCGIEKMLQMIVFESRDGDTDVENKRTDTRGRGSREAEADKRSLLLVHRKHITRESTLQHRELCSLLCGDLNGEQIQETGVPVAKMVKYPLQCRRRGFDPWVRKIACSRKWLPTAVFLPGDSHGQRSLAGYRQLGCKTIGHDCTTQRLTTVSLSLHM